MPNATRRHPEENWPRSWGSLRGNYGISIAEAWGILAINFGSMRRFVVRSGALLIPWLQVSDALTGCGPKTEDIPVPRISGEPEIRSICLRAVADIISAPTRLVAFLRIESEWGFLAERARTLVKLLPADVPIIQRFVDVILDYLYRDPAALEPVQSMFESRGIQLKKAHAEQG